VARRPARLERAGALTPRDRMWAAIRALSVSRDPDTEAWFSPAEVIFLTGLHPDTVDSYFRGLTNAKPAYLGLADGERPQGRRRSELFLYRLVRDVGVDAPRVTRDGRPVIQGVGTERMWVSMKVLREFDHGELAQAASDGEHQVNETTAKSYCAFLWRAGYLALATRNNGPHAKARYRFNRARNTGPRAPLVTRAKEVMDANTGELMWKRGGGER